jgi:DNA-directed RNA polymerase specialized sigma subunit
MKETIKRVMQTLPEQERIVVSMFYMGGYALK